MSSLKTGIVKIRQPDGTWLPLGAVAGSNAPEIEFEIDEDNMLDPDDVPVVTKIPTGDRTRQRFSLAIPPGTRGEAGSSVEMTKESVTEEGTGRLGTKVTFYPSNGTTNSVNAVNFSVYDGHDGKRGPGIFVGNGLADIEYTEISGVPLVDGDVFLDCGTSRLYRYSSSITKFSYEASLVPMVQQDLFYYDSVVARPGRVAVFDVVDTADTRQLELDGCIGPCRYKVIGRFGYEADGQASGVSLELYSSDGFSFKVWGDELSHRHDAYESEMVTWDIECLGVSGSSGVVDLIVRKTVDPFFFASEPEDQA